MYFNGNCHASNTACPIPNSYENPSGISANSAATYFRYYELGGCPASLCQCECNYGYHYANGNCFLPDLVETTILKTDLTTVDPTAALATTLIIDTNSPGIFIVLNNNNQSIATGAQETTKDSNINLALGLGIGLGGAFVVAVLYFLLKKKEAQNTRFCC